MMLRHAIQIQWHFMMSDIRIANTFPGYPGDLVLSVTVSACAAFLA